MTEVTAADIRAIANEVDKHAASGVKTKATIDSVGIHFRSRYIDEDGVAHNSSTGCSWQDLKDSADKIGARELLIWMATKGFANVTGIGRSEYRELNND